MRILKCGFLCGLLSMVSVRFAGAEVDSLFHVYLLFGQSNMAGGAGGSTDEAGRALITDECDTNPRVKVMAFGDCNQNSSYSRGQPTYYRTPPFHLIIIVTKELAPRMSSGEYCSIPSGKISP